MFYSAFRFLVILVFSVLSFQFFSLFFNVKRKSKFSLIFKCVAIRSGSTQRMVLSPEKLIFCMQARRELLLYKLTGIAYLSRRTGISGSGGDPAGAAAAGSVVVVSAAPAASATAAGPSAAAAAAASGRLAMVGVVTGSWRGGSDGWRAVPLNQPLPSDSGLRQFVIITHVESFIDLCSYIRAKKIKAGL